jgi:hypothetical protein
MSTALTVAPFISARTWWMATAATAVLGFALLIAPSVMAQPSDEAAPASAPATYLVTDGIVQDIQELAAGFVADAKGAVAHANRHLVAAGDRIRLLGMQTGG